MTPTAKLLAELIALPSVNNSFLSKGHPNVGEGRVAEYLAALGAKAGLDIEFQKVLPGRQNLIARLRPIGKVRRTILLAPHLDTVNIANENQLKPRIKGGRMYGRGACDTKGSVATFFGAICDLSKSSGRPRETEILFAGLVDEEHAQAGSRFLAQKKFKTDFAIVGEPTSLCVATAHKGALWLNLETHGRAAHGALPWCGQNAVHEMARVVDALETDLAARLRKRRHPLLGCASINVGTIHGGTQPNIVPDHCVISADRRTLPGESESDVCREIATFLQSRKLKAKVSSVKLAPCYPMETDRNLPLVRAFLNSIRQKQPIGLNYFSDAGVLAHAGIPSVVFGPGDIAHAHTANEWIELAQLDRGRAMLLRFLKSLP